MQFFVVNKDQKVLKFFIKRANVTYLLSTGVHLFFTFFFFYHNIPALFVWNILSTCLYLYLTYLNNKNKILFPASIAILEIYLYSIFATLCIGWETSFHFYLIVAFLIYSFAFRVKLYFRYVLAGIILLTYLGLYFFKLNYLPIYYLPENVLFLITVFNISLSIFVFTIITLGYNQIIDLIESELKSRQSKLEDLNKAKDKFFSLISHDLKSPISTLVGLSDLMTERFSTYNSEKQLKFLRQINLSHKEMYKLVTNLLDWSRTQQGKIAIFLIDFNIAKIIDETISLIQNMADEKRITFRKIKPNDYIVNADIQMIKTVLRNLITNAVKFSYMGSVIDIATYKEGETLHVKITDYGIGIAKEHIEHIFSIDRTLFSKGTNNEQGTGLGLIICKEFIEKNKGSIRVESSIQKGSTFIFTLPLSKNQTEADSVS